MRIRDYQDADAPAVGRLISETYREYNLSHADPEEQDRLLGPFQHAFSEDLSHREAIRSILQSPMLYVADDDDEIVGVLRGRKNVLTSLFVEIDIVKAWVVRWSATFERGTRTGRYTAARRCNPLCGPLLHSCEISEIDRSSPGTQL